VLLEFREPEPLALLGNAQILAEDIDLDLLWECAPPDEFGFTDMGAEYFGHAPTPTEAAALVLRLHSAPMYFYRKGRGRYKAAPAESLKAALASIERKKQQAVLQVQYVEELKAQRLPDAFLGKVRELLFKPDKSSIEYKALEEACNALSTTPPRLMLATGGLASEKELHLQRFLFSDFPRGTGFPELDVPPVTDALPLAEVQAFSIDDHMTTEIDDALSVQSIAGGYRIGIHIAAPGLAIQPGDAIDQIARERYSTVYMPGEKITMLPDRVVEVYTLAEGRACPALSLYVDVQVTEPEGTASEGTASENPAVEEWTITHSESRVELVPIAHNLRHNALDAMVTVANLAAGLGDYPCKTEIGVLWKFAQSLNAKRQAARVASGLRPEMNNRADYNFYIAPAEDAEGEARAEQVSISQRKRGAPLDTLVAELMILANSTWGKLLAERGVPGIYRAQNAGFGPSARVRMVTHAAPHVGLGVAQYAWSTSPLRRYVDMVNQWQLLACIQNHTAPFKKNAAELFSIVSGFDAAYAAYAEIQNTMERYWCLRWLQQHSVRVTEALVQREDNVSLTGIPLQFRVPGLLGLDKPLPRGTRVEVELLATDLVDLSVECRLLAIIEEVDDDALLEMDEADDADDTQGIEGTKMTDAADASIDASVAEPRVDRAA
jgi:exoribonuclease-2